MPLEAVPNQLCSNHNFETFVLPESGNSVHFPNPDISSAKSVFLSSNKLGRLRPSYEGIAGRGVARHMSALLTTNRNQLIFIIMFFASLAALEVVSE